MPGRCGTQQRTAGADSRLRIACRIAVLLLTDNPVQPDLRSIRQFPYNLLDVAGEAQTLAAALNHSAFNIANAIGAGLGWTSTGWVAAALALGGLAIWVVTILADKVIKPRGVAARRTADIAIHDAR